MRKRLRGRLTFANVISMTALFVALGGGAYAAAQLDSGDIKNNSLKSGDYKNDKTKGKDVLESSLEEVPLATSADNGVQGFALITPAGAVDPAAPSLNITSANVSRASEGVYCFNGLPFTPRSIEVTGEATGSLLPQDNFFIGSVLTNSGGCPGTEQATVESRDDDPAGAAALQDSDFYVVLL